MKRIYLLTAIVLLPVTVFAQHPYSRGGSPMYWALVGAFGGLLYYLIPVGFSFLMGAIKRMLRKDNNDADDTGTEGEVSDLEIETVELTKKEEAEGATEDIKTNETITDVPI